MKKILAGILFIAVVLGGFAFFSTRTKTPEANTTVVYGAVGGGKEGFLADPEIAQILLEEYDIIVKNTTLSNSLLNDEKLSEQSGEFDFAFFSDVRYYIDYQNNARSAKKYKPRGDGYIALNTPIVLYSWTSIAEALANEGIVTKTDGVYYVTDMSKLLEYQNEQKTWDNIGLPYSSRIRIESVDPVTSSPGVTYYGYIASILNGGDINEGNPTEAFVKLKAFYKNAGMMFNAPKDLFSLYTMMGTASKPLIEDYEKSLVEFATSDPDAYNSIKDKMAILYPVPGLLNSHCLISFSENGDKYLEAIRTNKRIQEIAFSRYGFRSGLSNDVGKLSTADGEIVNVTGIPAELPEMYPGLKNESYDRIVQVVNEAHQESLEAAANGGTEKN